MAKPVLTQTKSLKSFVKNSGIIDFEQFFVKKPKGFDCTFFTLTPEGAEKIHGLVAKTITEPVNTQAALDGDYEVSWMTSTHDEEGNLLVDEDGNPSPKSTWLIHLHANDGTAGKGAINFD